MSNDDNAAEAHFAEIIEVDPDFPGAVLSLVSRGVTFENGTTLKLECREGGLSDQKMHISACGKKHVHLRFGMGTPLAIMNAGIVIAFAAAIVCDATQTWNAPPTIKDVRVALGALRTAVPELPNLIEWVETQLPILLPQIFAEPNPGGDEGPSNPNLH